MRPGQYAHPADEFDEVPPGGRPRGAHRAPRSRWARWRPFVAVLVVFPALAYGFVTWLSDWDGLSGVDLPTFADSTEDPAEETDDAAPEETDDEAPVEPEEPETPVEPEPVADLSRPVQVFNATGTTGLAAGGADRVEAAGFTTVTAGNWQGDDVDTSVVYYPAAADVATAQAAAAALGIAAVQESAELAAEGIVVVLAADYVP